ncbi:hypothetical protein RB594_002166 [Gaeumannomyces avenae]
MGARTATASGATAASGVVPATLGDFSVLPVVFPASPAYPHAAVHHVYLRRHTPKIPTPDDDRSLFLANVPADSTSAHFRAVFAALVGAGKFEDMTFLDDQKRSKCASLLPSQAVRLARAAHNSNKRKWGEVEDDDEAAELQAARTLLETWPRRLRRSGSTAVAIMADERSVSLALKAIAKAHKTKKYPVWGVHGDSKDAPPPLGAPWLRGHNQLSFPDRELVESAVNSFFTLFNRREREAAELSKRLRNEPDADGFITVTRGGSSRTAPVSREEAERTRQRLAEREERRKAELSGGFYRFQQREKQKAEHDALARRFEDDRSKLQQLREKRKLKPET